MNRLLLAAVPLALLASCSQETNSSTDALGGPNEADDASSSKAADADSAASPATPDEDASGPAVLTAAGFGPHRVGQKIALVGPTPPKLAFDDNPDCHMYRDSNLPGMWIMTDGKEIVRRISILAPSTIATEKGVAVGSSEALVRAAYPDARKERSEYAEPPAGALYPKSADQTGLRFDVDGDEKVVEIHAGEEPWLGFSEGCA